MNINDTHAPHSRRDASDHDRRIEQLRQELTELSGGQFVEGSLPGCPPELRATFLENVLAFEKAPRVPLRDILARAGFQFPAPGQMESRLVTPMLWHLIGVMARTGVFLEHTDHLTDGELYGFLWDEVLPSDTVDLPASAGFYRFVDPLDRGTEEDSQLYLKHYADDFWRAHWAQEFPADPIPDHVDPPYQRDRLLPRPDLQT